jgi:Fe-S cluster biogenesis protein NfuA
MSDTFDARTFQSRLERLDRLIGEVEHFADPAAKSHAREMVRALLELHETGLSRLLHHIDAAGEAGQSVLDSCVADGVVSGLMLLHGLHPLSLENRVLQALEGVRPYLRSHGGNVELLSLDDGVVRLRLQGSCHSCPSSTVTMQSTIEEAIYGRAPEIVSIAVESSAEDAANAIQEGMRFALPVL